MCHSQVEDTMYQAGNFAYQIGKNNHPQNQNMLAPNSIKLSLNILFFHLSHQNIGMQDPLVSHLKVQIKNNKIGLESKKFHNFHLQPLPKIVMHSLEETRKTTIS